MNDQTLAITLLGLVCLALAAAFMSERKRAGFWKKETALYEHLWRMERCSNTLQMKLILESWPQPPISGGDSAAPRQT